MLRGRPRTCTIADDTLAGLVNPTDLILSSKNKRWLSEGNEIVRVRQEEKVGVRDDKDTTQ
jgi:hypothetical protein